MKQQAEQKKDQKKGSKFRIMLIAAIITGVLLTAEFFVLGYGILKIFRYLAVLSGLFVIAWIDQNEKRIPNKILLILLAVRVVILIIEAVVYSELGLSILFSAILGGFIGGGLFIFAYILSRGGMGMGDVKLFAVLGCYMGGGSIFAVIFLTVISSAAYSVIMLMLKKIKLKEEIPFAPFVLLGTILAMALGI